MSIHELNKSIGMNLMSDPYFQRTLLLSLSVREKKSKQKSFGHNIIVIKRMDNLFNDITRPCDVPLLSCYGTCARRCVRREHNIVTTRVAKKYFCFLNIQNALNSKITTKKKKFSYRYLYCIDNRRRFRLSFVYS